MIAGKTSHAGIVTVRHAYTEEHFARFDYEHWMRRRLGYYLWRGIGPLTLIVIMSWAVFWIDPAQLGVQVGIASTSMLTLIAFLFALGRTLPPVSYLTRMDSFIFGSVCLVFLAFTEAIITCNLAANRRQDLARRVDWWARWSFPIAFMVLVIFAFWI